MQKFCLDLNLVVLPSPPQLFTEHLLCIQHGVKYEVSGENETGANLASGKMITAEIMTPIINLHGIKCCPDIQGARNSVAFRRPFTRSQSSSAGKSSGGFYALSTLGPQTRKGC